MDATNPILDSENASSPARGRGELVFEDVHFRHDDTEPGTKDLVNGISLHIKPGETMALVGVTGSGKTTVTALPARLYDVTGGRILLDGGGSSNLSRRQDYP